MGQRGGPEANLDTMRRPVYPEYRPCRGVAGKCADTPSGAAARKDAMLDSELKVNQFLMQYCRTLVADVADERMAEQPLPGVNHPAWILGHLAFSADRARWLLGGEKEMPAAWLA